MAREEHFFHGTTEHLRPGDKILPVGQLRGKKPTFPHDTSREHAYATPHESSAWHYAEMSWHATDRGVPRVYQVTPLGDHEPDPTHDQHGRYRNNREGDRRSRAGWKVVSERQMPEHMGTPDEWK